MSSNGTSCKNIVSTARKVFQSKSPEPSPTPEPQKPRWPSQKPDKPPASNTTAEPTKPKPKSYKPEKNLSRGQQMNIYALLSQVVCQTIGLGLSKTITGFLEATQEAT